MVAWKFNKAYLKLFTSFKTVNIVNGKPVVAKRDAFGLLLEIMGNITSSEKTSENRISFSKITWLQTFRFWILGRSFLFILLVSKQFQIILSMSALNLADFLLTLCFDIVTFFLGLRSSARCTNCESGRRSWEFMNRKIWGRGINPLKAGSFLLLFISVVKVSLNIFHGLVLGVRTCYVHEWRRTKKTKKSKQ